MSVGRARETTRSRGRMSFNSSSLFSAISAEVRATSLSLVSSPASLAMATAVSFRSPVTMTTWMPALRTSLMAWTASLRTLSRMLITHSSVISPSSPSPSALATASRRMERLACSRV